MDLAVGVRLEWDLGLVRGGVEVSQARADRGREATGFERGEEGIVKGIDARELLAAELAVDLELLNVPVKDRGVDEPERCEAERFQNRDSDLPLTCEIVIEREAEVGGRERAGDGTIEPGLCGEDAGNAYVKQHFVQLTCGDRALAGRKGIAMKVVKHDSVRPHVDLIGTWRFGA